MKKVVYLMLVVCLGLFSNTINAQDLRKGGSSFGKIESNGDVRISGSVKGKFESNGDIIVSGSVIGKI
jgi:cytoskeletal protein CcmA (bactofilin family)